MLHTLRPLWLLALACALACASALHAADFHVAPPGDDRGPGTSAKPFATLHAARAAARAGLVQGDLIQALDGQKTKTASDLLALSARAYAATVRLTVVRSQQETTLTAPAR